MKVYEAINAVMAAMSKDGITKDRNNQQQGYKFRGVDDVYNALSPVLAENHLMLLPRVLSRQCEERETKNGGRMAYVAVEVEFDLVSSEDGSKHTIRTIGEAMDSADKATNKAMSAAYKYAAFMAFCIPTEADNDADAHTHELKPQSQVDRDAIAAAKIRQADIDREFIFNELKAKGIEYKAEGKDAILAFLSVGAQEPYQNYVDIPPPKWAERRKKLEAWLAQKVKVSVLDSYVATLAPASSERLEALAREVFDTAGATN